jgi:hypothetical protein
MEQQYMIHNVARARHNRAFRAALPQNPRMKQYVGDRVQRLVRGQPLVVSADMVRRNLQELREKNAKHILEVRTTDGRLVDLSTLEAAPPLAVEPKPHPRLDSLANDKNFPLPPGYKFIAPNTSDDSTMPQLVASGEKPALLQGLEVPEPTPAAEAGDIPETPEAAVVAQPPQDDPAPVVVDNDSELEAALAQAQADAADGPAATEGEGVSSVESKKGKRNRR